jgi:3-oxoacyl-[acyl-carrier protein] reductase
LAHKTSQLFQKFRFRQFFPAFNRNLGLLSYSPQKKRERQGPNRTSVEESLMDAQLSGKNIVVTGASGGIGGEVVNEFIAEGANVVAHFFQNEKNALELASQLGSRCLPVKADLTQDDDVAALFAEAERAFGPVHVLIANAGKWPPDDVPVHEMSLEQWNSTLAVNLTSVFLCIRHFFRGIVKHKLQDPAAVLVGSTAAIFGEAGHGDYAASKAGLTYGLCRTLKNEICRIAPRGRVNVVCPGWTFTPMTQRFADDKARVRKVLQTIPLRKVGRPQDVARAMVYLASRELSGHVSGQMITVSGGMEGRVLYSSEEIEFDG